MHSVRSARDREMTGSGKIAARSRRIALLALVALLCAPVLPAIATDPLRIVALGDSLTAGLGLAEGDAFPVKLQNTLRAKGHNIEVINAGVSGDTVSGGLARLDWSVPNGTAAVILELGANDALRAVDPAVIRKALEAMIVQLRERKIPVLLAGMRAPRNLGADYVAAFDGIYPDLANAYDLVFYPFFLDGVATDAKLNQGDGIHPNAAGVDLIVARILPAVEELIARAKK
jgi:acyl-CoA thioesterase-1